MSILKNALELASLGFKIFPLQINSKLPLIQDFPNVATSDPAQIKRWWLDPILELEQPYNIGISTTSFGDGEALVVIDVDNKGKKKGSETLTDISQGKDLPVTFTQTTPSGGFHFIYRCPVPLRQGVEKLGPGLDIRSKGGYVVGRGSIIDGIAYGGSLAVQINHAPEWLIEACQPAPRVEKKAQLDTSLVNQDRVLAQGKEILMSLPPAGSGTRNHQAFVAACKLKDEGADQATAFELMQEFFKSEPPLDTDEIAHVVSSAYRYGSLPQGVSAPEVVFTPSDKESIDAPSSQYPFDQLNSEYAFVLAGGGSHILWETTDPDGKPHLDHLSVQAFHQKHSAWTIQVGDKVRAVTRLWMNSPKRRSYDGLCFSPGQETPANWYNMWRGFAVDPLPKGEKPSSAMQEAVAMFIEHARENVAQGDQNLYNWLMGYFAHLIQFPGDKPLTALVFRGEKGVGKNALVERVGALLGSHFKVAADRRYLLGNFNAHMERTLLFVLDEAFWSGDKQAEGVLKSLITSRTHLIEHKGKEAYEVKNCMRVVIIGNEDWLVPATNDERRFAVFDVGSGRKQDNAYFFKMRKLMEGGGYRYLLRFLLDYEIGTIDVNKAPSTQGLLDQKLESLPPVNQWWFESLKDGRVAGSDMGDEWPALAEKERLREAFKRYMKSRNINSRLPTDSMIGKALAKFSPLMKQVRISKEGSRPWAYEFPNLAACREAWEVYVGHPIKWD